MKIVNKILLGVAIVLAVPLTVALFTRNDYAVEREITVGKPKDEVFGYVKYLRNQDRFSKWANMDPKMKKEYRGTDGTVGFVSAWESKQDDVGKGEQQIIGIREGQRIECDLHFIEPFEGRANAYMTTEAVSDRETKVKWGFTSRMPYPMNLMLLCMDMEKMIGDDLQTGLANLKNNLEQPQPLSKN
ncbi:SRPBCC family protein [Paraflavisolibacter sp. H34]|uniref:SRPBCC family protein n=1 Tax=Huijunlia imazamoxiresistens TaxID=3127457 RepID=UPI0030188749